ncbi:MAG: hypothetical protein WD826_12465, partial [Actinomycetota bacterium]
SLAVLSVLAGELRHAGGIPAALTGEAPSTVQTGKMSAGLLANAIDFVVQKIHRKFERSVTLEKEAAVAIVKTHGRTSPHPVRRSSRRLRSPGRSRTTGARRTR